MSRKAQIGIQFNWIFVLIVGAIILIFFFSLIRGQQKGAAVEEATDLVENLDTIFTAISTNPDTVQSFTIMNAEVEFDCEPGLWQYYIQGAGPVNTRYDPIFVPSLLEGDEVIAWTMTWRIPFEVTVFTNLASDRTLFIFVANDANDDIKQLYSDMPDEFRKTLVGITTLDDAFIHGYDRYTIIADQDVEPHLPAGTIDDVFIRVIRSELSDLDTYGTITFTDEGKTAEKWYVSEEMLWGSFFTQDADTYQCTIDKALTRLQIIAHVLYRKTDYILNDPDVIASDCYPIITSAYDGPFTDLTDLSTIGSLSDAETLYETWRDIETRQQVIMRGELCPELY